MYLSVYERYYNRKEIDSRKLNYLFYRVDIRKAAQKVNRFIPLKTTDATLWDKDHAYKTADYMNGLTLSDQATAITEPQAGNPKLFTITKDGGSPSSSQSTDAKKQNNLGWYDVTTNEIMPGGLVAPPTVRRGYDRSVFVVKEVINVYPDTLAWVHDFLTLLTSQ